MRELDSIADQQARCWRQDGVAVFRGAINNRWLEVLRDGVEQCQARQPAITLTPAKDGFTDHHMFRCLDAFHQISIRVTNSRHCRPAHGIEQS